MSSTPELPVGESPVHAPEHDAPRQDREAARRARVTPLRGLSTDEEPEFPSARPRRRTGNRIKVAQTLPTRVTDEPDDLSC